MTTLFDIDPVKQSVQLNSRSVKLPNYSFRLLQLLAENAPSPVSFEEIERIVWGAQVTRETIKQRVRLLRSALAEIGAPSDTIETAHSIGYRMTVTASGHAPEKLSRPIRQPRSIAALAAAFSAAIVLAVFLFKWPGGAVEGHPLRIAVLHELALGQPDQVDKVTWFDANRLLAGQLSQLQGVDAIATMSSDAIGAGRMRDAARTLGANMIVSSALIERNGEIVMSYQLIDGVSETILWAGEYEYRAETARRAVSHSVKNVKDALSRTGFAFHQVENQPGRASTRAAYFDVLSLLEANSVENTIAAIERLDALLEVEPAFALARGLRARLTADLIIRNEIDAAHADNALRDARAAVAQEPAIAELKYALARAELAAGDKRAALVHLQEASHHLPFVERDIAALERRLAHRTD